MNLVVELSEETTSPSIKSLVAEVDNQVIGYVSFSPIFLKSDSSISGYILAPLAVAPKHQKKGIGSNLIKSGIDMLTENGVGVLLVYGDPDYYGRFGFKAEIGLSFVPPYSLQYPFGWTGMMLNETSIPEQPIQFDCVTALSKPELW
jgi:putative acetyltransferase